MYFSLPNTGAQFLIVLLSAQNFASAACVNPPIRSEWRTLSKTNQLSYIGAVKCMQSLPGTTANLYPGVRSRYDDYQGLHINQTDFIHFVGFFQPWHRFFVASYESDLRVKCGYTGAQPYWDWTLDATVEGFPKSPVFDPVFGFGGNGPYINSTLDDSVRLHIPGKTGGGCVENGPFKNRNVTMGPGFSTTYNPHCLTRDLAPYFASFTINSTFVELALAAPDFAHFDIIVEGGISVPEMTYHGGGHLSVGGDLGVMGDVYASPGDPLFYLHHANMDRLWWQWQQASFEARSVDIAGPDTQFAYPFNFFGDIPYTNVTIDYEMNFFELVPENPTVKVADVMNIQDGLLCYDYA